MSIKIKPNHQKLIFLITIALITIVLILFAGIILRPRQDRATSNAEKQTAAVSEAEAPAAESAGNASENTEELNADMESETSDAEAEALPTNVPERLSYLSPEYFENQTETNGIIIGGTIIAMIILLSTGALLILEQIRDNQNLKK